MIHETKKTITQSIKIRTNLNIKKLNSVINEYEQKLDNHIEQLIHNIINKSKLINQGQQQEQKEIEIEKQKEKEKLIQLPNIFENKKLNIRRNKNKNQSNSFHFNHNNNNNRNSKNRIFNNTMIINENYNQTQEFYTALSNIQSFKNSHITSVEGRPIGKNKGKIKPKVIKKQIQIVPRHIRLDPFSNKNSIKAHQLDKGMLNLIQRGKVGQQVNIITAFQRGKPILDMKQAIMHYAEQRFSKQGQQKQTNPENMNSQQFSNNIINNELVIKQYKQNLHNNHWSLTIPQHLQQINDKNNRGRRQIKIRNEKIQQIRQSIHIKILHYVIIYNKNYNLLKLRNLDRWGSMLTIFKQIQQLCKMYAIQILYIDQNRVNQISLIQRKLRKQQLIYCMIGNNNNNNNDKYKIFKISNINNIEIQKILSINKIINFIKRNKKRIEFKKYMKKQLMKNKIKNWINNKLIITKIKKEIKKKNIKIEQNYLQLQQKFKKQYNKIINQPYYQIHISNKQYNKNINNKYKQNKNTQITRIFNLSNLNTNIIFLLSQQLTNQTINYYYKIMQLQDIPNYKNRVIFLSVNQNKQLPSYLTISQKLYYNSKILRKLKNIIHSFPAFFCISYPSQIDIKISVWFNKPILGFNLLKSTKLFNKSNINSIYSLPHLQTLSIEPKKMNKLTLLFEIMKFCSTFKRNKKFLVKINKMYQSSGIGILYYPFNCLSEMYQNTQLILNYHLTIELFYQKLLKLGGIIEKYQQNLSVITVVSFITNQNQFLILGTFEKITLEFVNIGYFFPQKKIAHKILINSNEIILKQLLLNDNYFGPVEITFYIDLNSNLYLSKIQCYLTTIGSSLFYFKFLSFGQFNQNGNFITKIINIYQINHKEQQISTQEIRTYCYLPFIIHFGLSSKQCSSFFQLCRMNEISFDLENKYGCTFILLGSLQQTIGLLTTAKQKSGTIKLMIKSLEFMLRQNSQNLSNKFLQQKQFKMQERNNIITIRQYLQQL